MKKFLSIIVLGLLWFNPLFSDEYDWKKIVKKNTPNINLYLGDDLQEKTKKPLFDKLIKNMGLSHQMPKIDDENYFLKAGCKVHSCPEKGVVWIDKNKEILNVDEVLIENQPSLKNPTMKTVSSLLFGYFMMRGIIDKNKTKSTITNVRFINPSNKLKVNKDKTIKVLQKTADGQKYKMTKKLGIEYTKIILQNEKKWLTYLDTYKKKDDLCDALLQGYYYMSKIK